MMNFRLMTMVYDSEDKRSRYVCTITSCEGGVSVYETHILLNNVIGRTILHDCDPEIVLLMIQDKHRNNYRIADYIYK